ncbi:MAG: MobA/MobL family protein [Acidaminococcaceae bacterium]|nr:MobA/MobL family protein [Acidaminococcaceae bacterium]
MAISVFHVDDKPLLNNNLIQRASYISRETLHDDMYNKQRSPHKAKADRLYHRVLLPEQAPQKYKDVQDWTDKKNIEMLWNDVNATGYVRVARSYYAALPKEASLGEDIELVNSFVQEAFVSKGYIVQYDIHDEKKQTKKRQKKNSLEKRINIQLGKNDGNGNIHVHILVADMPCRDGKLVRARTENGKSKTVYIDMDGSVIDMIDTPILRKGKLQVNKDGSIKTKKGYQRLVVDDNGQPVLNKDGKALLEDIRVATNISTSKDGKYTKTTYKRLTIKTNPMDNIKEYDQETNQWEDVNYQSIRKLWEKNHNAVIKKHSIKNENGELALINMDSYEKQDKDKPAEQQRVPQQKEWDKKNKRSHEAVANNQIIKKRNQNALALQKLQEENAQLDKQIEKANSEFQKDKAIVDQIDPKAEWTEAWVKQQERINKVTFTHYAHTNKILRSTISRARKKIESMTSKLTKREQIEKQRIIRHHNIISQLEKRIRVENLTEPEKIKSLADEAWDKMTDQQKVSFVRDRYGFDTGTIYARVLAREKNNVDVIDGLEQTAPKTPDNKTTLNIIQNEAEYYCETRDIVKYQNNAYAKWDTASYKAPPKELINVLNVYATVDGYYTAKLTSEPWKTVSCVGGFNYNLDEIEKEARLANEQLEKEEAAEKVKVEATQKTVEVRAKAETEQKQGTSDPKPKLLAKKLTIISLEGKIVTKAKDVTINKQQEITTPKQQEQQPKTEKQKPIPLTKAELQKCTEPKEVFRQAEIQRQAKQQQQAEEYRRQKIRSSYEQLIPQYQLAVAAKDQDTVNKISALVRSAFSADEIEMKYKGSKSWRDTELNSMVNRYIDLKTNGGINEDAKRELEQKFFDRRGKIIVRNVNKAIAEHNKTATEYNQIDTKDYRRYSDNANFWYGVQNPDKTIRSNKTENPAISKGTPELQIETDKSRHRRSFPETTSNQHRTGPVWEVLPDGTTRPLAIGPNVLKKDDKHEKSEMEKAEEELYQGWDPWKNGKGM